MIAFAIGTVLFGALVRGYTGFGSAMFWVAGLVLVLPPVEVVPVVLVLEVVASLVLLPASAGRVEWKSMSWMLLATVITLPIGVVLLTVASDRSLRFAVGGLILVGTLAMAAGVEFARGSDRSSGLIAGALSGVCNGSTGIGGPPAVLLYFSPSKSVEVGRATLIAYFLGADAATFAIMAQADLVDTTVLGRAALLAVPTAAGALAGQALFRKFGDRGFRNVTISLLIALGVATLVKASFG